MNKIETNIDRCKGCGYCVEVCPKKALSFSTEVNQKGYHMVVVDQEKCISCGSCYRVCPDYVFTVL